MLRLLEYIKETLQPVRSIEYTYKSLYFATHKTFEEAHKMSCRQCSSAVQNLRKGQDLVFCMRETKAVDMNRQWEDKCIITEIGKPRRYASCLKRGINQGFGPEAASK